MTSRLRRVHRRPRRALTDHDLADIAPPTPAPRNFAGPAVAPSASVPETLVGLGFRGWIHGYQTGDIGPWEEVWSLYATVLGPNDARVVVTELAHWSRAVCASALRPVCVADPQADCFCRDECLAIAMVAACQHNTCPAMRACAFALIESNHLDEVLHYSASYAITMRGLAQMVGPHWIVNASQYMPDSSRTTH